MWEAGGIPTATLHAPSRALPSRGGTGGPVPWHAHTRLPPDSVLDTVGTREVTQQVKYHMLSLALPPRFLCVSNKTFLSVILPAQRFRPSGRLWCSLAGLGAPWPRPWSFLASLGALSPIKVKMGKCNNPPPGVFALIGRPQGGGGGAGWEPHPLRTPTSAPPNTVDLHLPYWSLSPLAGSGQQRERGEGRGGSARTDPPTTATGLQATPPHTHTYTLSHYPNPNPNRPAHLWLPGPPRLHAPPWQPPAGPGRPELRTA